MLTRRDAMIGAMSAGALMSTKQSFAKAAQPATPVNFDVPADACDCHTHIHGDPDQFPFFAGRIYTPESALPEEMAALHRALRVKRVVIVTPSVYGTDNSATLYGMKPRGADARGVAVIAGIKDLVLASPVPVVFDHFGGAQAALGLTQPGFADLVALVGSGKAYVKISGAYRASTQAPDYPDVAPLARALIAANAERIVWGTDWPHPNSAAGPGHKVTDISPLWQIDDGALMNQLPAWASEPATRKTILVDNPARLYGF